jgi:hypothetical protein
MKVRVIGNGIMGKNQGVEEICIFDMNEIGEEE